MSALPVGDAFWRELASGLRVDEAQIADWVDQAQREGIIAGLWLEPNPQHPINPESLVHGTPPDGAVVRWTANTEDGPLHSACGDGVDGWAARAWFKAAPIPPLEEQSTDPFAVEEDRTLLVLDGSRAPEELTASEEAAFMALSLPRTISPPETPLTLASAERADVAQAIVKRAARRLAWRVSPAAIGFAAAVLAVWDIDEADAPKAAGALARMRLAGDVAVRDGDAEWGGNLSVVLWGRTIDEARTTAATVASKWGRDPEKVVDLSLD